MQGNELSSEIANEQITKFRDYYDIGEDALNEEQQDAIAQPLQKLIRYVMNGSLSFDEDCIVVTQHLKSGETLIYKEISGKAKLEMGKQPDENVHARIYALMGSLCGLDISGMAKLKGRDLRCMEMLGLLFISM